MSYDEGTIDYAKAVFDIILLGWADKNKTNINWTVTEADSKGLRFKFNGGAVGVTSELQLGFGLTEIEIRTKIIDWLKLGKPLEFSLEMDWP